MRAPKASYDCATAPVYNTCNFSFITTLSYSLAHCIIPLIYAKNSNADMISNNVKLAEG